MSFLFIKSKKALQNDENIKCALNNQLVRPFSNAFTTHLPLSQTVTPHLATVPTPTLPSEQSVRPDGR